MTRFCECGNNVFGNKLPYQKNEARAWNKSEELEAFRHFRANMIENEQKKQYRQFFHIPKLNDLVQYTKYLFPKGVSSCKSNKKRCGVYRNIKYDSITY